MLSRGSLIFSSVIISSLMDKEQFSIYSYFILTTTTISIYSALGIGITTNKFFSSLKKELNLETPVMTLWIINISLAILGGVIFTLLSEQIIPKSINFNKNYFSLVILFFMFGYLYKQCAHWIRRIYKIMYYITPFLLHKHYYGGDSNFK